MKTNNDFSILSIEKVINTLSSFYTSAINNNAPFKDIPSVMLWGAPGVGKSQGIREIAKEIEKNTGKRVVVTDVRLLLFNPIDLRGIPTSNADKTLAVWLKPKIFQMDDSADIVNILFLDEISAAPQTVQAAAYQITLDRVVGEHKLPDNCLVIAAGNRITDKSVSFKMPKALANRFIHFEIEGSFSSWQKWAIRHNINDKILGFLAFRNDRLFGFDSSSDNLAFATPRSWEMVSNVLKYTNNNLDIAKPLITGLIGYANAVEFFTWCNVYSSLPSVKDIFNGTETKVPKSVDSLYAVVYSITSYIKEHTDDMNGFSNCINYARRLPHDFAQLLFFNFSTFEDKVFKDKLLGIPEFAQYAKQIGEMSNGNF